MARGRPDRPEDSFTEQFPQLLALAYRVAYRILGDRDDAHDIAAETLARACARASRVEDGAEPWVVIVAGRAAIDAVRRSSTARRHLQQSVPRDGRQQTRDDAAELRLDLQKALLALPTRQCEVVVLRHLADRSEQETARALGLSVGTVTSHSSRGLAALRAALTPSTETR